MPNGICVVSVLQRWKFLEGDTILQMCQGQRELVSYRNTQVRVRGI